MNRRFSRKIMLYLILSVLMSLMLGSCNLIERIRDEGKEQQTNIRDETYSIVSSTLLESLSQGEEDAFILLTATPAAFPSPSDFPVRWNQNDHITIAKAFYRTGWQDQENVDEWKVKNLFFGLKCSEIPYGPQSAGINFFLAKQEKDKAIRVLRHLFIAANDNMAVLSETEYYPLIEKWPAINLASITIPVEDALQIAENNGGAKFRNEVDDNCSINAEIRIENNSEEWIISYSGLADQKKEFLRMNINATTGEIMKGK